MKIYTSYWAMVRNFPQNLVGLNTTIFPPKWRPLGFDKRKVLVLDCPPIKPGQACDGLCNGKCSPKHPQDCLFLKTYYEQLCNIDFDNFINHLENLKNKIELGENLTNIDFALIVFEAPSNLCSERQMIQRWFKENNYNIKEWKVPKW